MSKRTKLIVLSLIIVSGFFMRCLCLHWGQGYRFAAIGDEIEAYRFALNFRDGQPAAEYLGQPNFRGGKVPGPLWALFWLMGLKLANGPQGVTVLILLLNTALIFLVYRLAQRLVGEVPSLWATLFYATSPWTVYFSLGAHNPLVMGFFGASLYLALWHVSTRDNSPHIFWVCVILMLMPQFHMVGVFILPAAIMVLFFSSTRLHRGWLATGLAVGAALYAPYLAGEARHHWSNTLKILHGDSHGFSTSVLKTLTLPVTILSNLTSSWFGRNLANYRAFGDAVFGSYVVLAVFNLVSISLAIASVVAFLTSVLQTLRSQSFSLRAMFQKSRPEPFLAVLLSVPLSLFLFTGHDFSSRYLAVLTPVLFLLPVRLIFDPTLPSCWRRLLSNAALATIAFNILVTLTYYYNQGRQIEAGDTFIPSFQKMESVRQLLQCDAGPNQPIRLDVSAFPHPTSESTAFGVVTLDKYLRLLQERTPSTSQETSAKTYRVLPAEKAALSGARAVFAGNGIVIIAEQ